MKEDKQKKIKELIGEIDELVHKLYDVDRGGEGELRKGDKK
ncbi:MAG: hypothetical protein V1770_05075 [bacterium]